jgi:acyl transferase domain-containing protein
MSCTDPEDSVWFWRRFGAFLSNIALFDTQMFGISAAEACVMDPQQRLLVETTADVLLEHRQVGQRLGVYVGIASSDYGSLVKGHTGAGEHRAWILI